jgi:hypothetical protein
MAPLAAFIFVLISLPSLTILIAYFVIIGIMFVVASRCVNVLVY